MRVCDIGLLFGGGRRNRVSEIKQYRFRARRSLRRRKGPHIKSEGELG